MKSSVLEASFIKWKSDNTSEKITEEDESVDQEKVIVIDFGGQYNQLVARRVRECNVYCEIYSYKTDIEHIKACLL